MAPQACNACADFPQQVSENIRNVPAKSDDTLARREVVQQPGYWSGVFAMTLCTFALVASEFMPVSLLTPVAADLNASAVLLLVSAFLTYMASRVARAQKAGFLNLNLLRRIKRRKSR